VLWYKKSRSGVANGGKQRDMLSRRISAKLAKRSEPPPAIESEDPEKTPRLLSLDDHTYWTELCASVSEIVVSAITPANKPRPVQCSKEMSSFEIETTYKIHEEACVRVKVANLVLFEHFRCIQYESNSYSKIKESLQVS